MPIDLGLEQATAELASEANTHLAAVDRAKALANIALRMLLRGERLDTDLLAAVEKIAKDRADQRLSRYSKAVVFLVLKYSGHVDFQPSESTRDLGEAIIGINAIDKLSLKRGAEQAFASVLAAIGTLSGEQSQELEAVDDGVAFNVTDGRPLYSLNLSGGRGRAYTGRRTTKADVEQISITAKRLSASRQWQTPSRLFAEALRLSNDRLEAFILLWAAIEMIISKATSGFESGAWIADVPTAKRETATALHAAWVSRGWRTYAFADKLNAMAERYEIENSEATLGELLKIKTDVREPLYHQGQFAEDTLPVERCMKLVRSLMNAVLS